LAETIIPYFEKPKTRGPGNPADAELAIPMRDRQKEIYERYEMQRFGFYKYPQKC
jgi:hypothetical protein